MARTKKKRKKTASRRKVGRPRTKAIKGKVGKKVTKKKKISTLKVGSKSNVWNIQDALRKDGYFARAVSSSKVATNAPLSKLK